MENTPSHKSRISTPINAAAIAAQPMGLIFSLYRWDAIVPRSRSIISVTAQYTHVEGLQAGMLNENILKLSIGITFNERWFFKRKVD